MRKQVSTPFAIIVVLFALAVGALYFMWQYNNYEAAERKEAEMLKRQAESAMTKRGSGGGKRGGGGDGGGRRGGRRGGAQPETGTTQAKPGGGTDASQTPEAKEKPATTPAPTTTKSTK